MTNLEYLKNKILCIEHEIKYKEETAWEFMDKIFELEHEKIEIEKHKDWHEQMSKTLKRALLIACDGDTMKAVKCIDRTITEPEQTQ